MLQSVSTLNVEKYQSCIVSRTTNEAIGLPWRTGSEELCNDPDLVSIANMLNSFNDY